MSLTVAKRYAKALFEFSGDAGQRDGVYRDMKIIEELTLRSSEFNEFVSDPSVTAEKRKNILGLIFKNKVCPVTFRFIGFLEYKNRLDTLKDVTSAFESLYLTDKKIAQATIVSCIPLSNAQRNTINKHLEDRLNKEIESEVHIDPNMLGGIKIQEGDTIYDYSLRTQLEEFRKNIIKA